MAFIGQSINLHIMAEIFSMDNLFSAVKTPLLVGDMMVNFGDIMLETSNSSGCWDSGRNSHLTCIWLSIDSLYIPILVYRTGTINPCTKLRLVNPFILN